MTRLRIEGWFLTLALWPWLGAAAVGAEAVLFRLIRGRWPIPSLDDPKLQSFLVFHFATQLIVISLPAILLVIAYFVVRQWRLFLRAREYRTAIVILALGVTAEVLLPSRIWEWFWD